MSLTLKLIGLICGFAAVFSLVGLLSVAWDWLRRPAAPAYFIGWQEVPGGEHFALFNLTRAIPGHPHGSTVSALTLENAGYRVRRPRLLPSNRQAKPASLFFARGYQGKADSSIGAKINPNGGRVA